MSSTFQFRQIEIELDDELRDYTDRVLKEVLPETAAAFQEEVDELRAYAQSNWPVKQELTQWRVEMLERLEKQGKFTGNIRKRSRDSKGKFAHGVRFTPDGLEAFVENRAPYAAFIREIGVGRKKGRHVHRRLLFGRFGAKRQRALWARVAKELG